MSNIIRAVRSPWLPPPSPESDDAGFVATNNTYRLAQIAIEAAQRSQQNQIQRTIRLGNINSRPAAQSVQPIRVPGSHNFVINLPIP